MAKTNAWLVFLKQFRAKNPKLSMKMQMKKGAIAYRAQKGSKPKAKGKKKK